MWEAWAENQARVRGEVQSGEHGLPLDGNETWEEADPKLTGGCGVYKSLAV